MNLNCIPNKVVSHTRAHLAFVLSPSLVYGILAKNSDPIPTVLILDLKIELFSVANSPVMTKGYVRMTIITYVASAC